MTLQEQIEMLKNGRYTASKPLSLEIIHKQSEIIKVAKEALKNAQLGFEVAREQEFRAEVMQTLATIEQMEK